MLIVLIVALFLIEWRTIVLIRRNAELIARLQSQISLLTQNNKNRV
jgi:hypothetical protein